MRIIATTLFALSLTSCDLSQSVQVGAGPNDMILVDSPNGRMLAVTASIDSSIQFFKVNEQSVSALLSTVFFPANKFGKSPNPWALASSDNGRFVFASLYDDHSVAVIDMTTQSVINTTSTSPELQHPTALRVFRDDVFVLFTNFQKWDATQGFPAEFGSGFVARFRFWENTLHFIDSVELPCKNPADIRIDSNATPVIVCAGSLKIGEGSSLILDHGAGLVTLDAVNPKTNAPLRIDSFKPLPFSTSKLIVASNGYFLLGNTKRQILFVPKDTTLPHELILVDEQQEEESGFLANFVQWNENIALLTDYKNDQIIAIDLATRSLNPPPFCRPIDISTSDLGKNKSSVVFKGPSSLVKTGTHNLVVLLGLSSELANLNPLQETLCP